MSAKNSLSAIAMFIWIVALTMAIPGVSHATGMSHRSNARNQSPGIVVAEDEQPGADADNDKNNDTDSKESDDDATAEDRDDANDPTDQQSAGNQQVAPQLQNWDNDADDEAEDGQAGQMNAYPQQVNPYR